jgi:ribosomal protein S18 acetylase RimI-like enzyme
VFATVIDRIARPRFGRARSNEATAATSELATDNRAFTRTARFEPGALAFPLVDGLQIRAMTQEEFSSYRRRTISHYAAELARTGACTAEEAETRAATESEQFLPDGLQTAGMALLIGETDGEAVGLVWVGPAPAGRAGWWVYDIEVVPARRGQGYGRALLEAAEREAQQRGAVSIGLDVFGGNDVALRMYESSGYEVAATRMLKRFASSSGPD